MNREALLGGDVFGPLVKTIGLLGGGSAAHAHIDLRWQEE